MHNEKNQPQSHTLMPVTEHGDNYFHFMLTKNHLKKGAMEAGKVIQSFFKTQAIHDYDEQEQGVIKEVNITSIENGESYIMTCYYPAAGHDKRFGVRGLKEALPDLSPGSIIAFFAQNKMLFFGTPSQVLKLRTQEVSSEIEQLRAVELSQSHDIFSLSKGDLVARKNLYDLIQYSKVESSKYWSGEDLVIGNTPQQGINWIGKLPSPSGVIIKAYHGAYEEDGWSDDSKTQYHYSFKACEDLGYHAIGVMVRLALQTSADRGTLLHGKSNSRIHRGLLKRDVAIFRNEKNSELRGEVFLFDTKTDNRSRTVPITDYLCRELLALCAGKEADECVFDFTYPQFDFPWQAIRKEAGFWSADKGFTLRFKDLRAQPSIYGEEAGIPQTVLSKTYGHSSDSMIRRYQQRSAAMTIDQAKELERRMFIFPDRTNNNTNKT